MANTTERPVADALTAIKTRRSVKEYLPTEIPREWIEELLDAAHWAPNHKLTHPWRFHVFTGEGRERLVSARQAAVRWAAEKKGEPVTEDALILRGRSVFRRLS
jgi:nitroreductase